MRLIVKDPDSEEPRGFDWTLFLAGIDEAETIATSTWAVTGPDAALTLSSASIVTGGLKTQVRLSGGTLGGRYIVTNSIVTSSGAVPRDDRSFRVLIQDR